MQYDINLEDKFGLATRFDADAEAAACDKPWFNQTLTTVNDAVVRLGVFHGEFHFHKHDDQDELFFVLEGKIMLDIENAETVVLERHQGYTVPRGVVHRPRAPERAVVLMVEEKNVVPTGD